MVANEARRSTVARRKTEGQFSPVQPRLTIGTGRRLLKLARHGDVVIAWAHSHRLNATAERAQGLLKLAFAVKEREGARRQITKPRLAESVGTATIDTLTSGKELVEFMGELTLSFQRLIRRKATFQAPQVWLAIQEAGVEALPIVRQRRLPQQPKD